MPLLAVAGRPGAGVDLRDRIRSGLCRCHLVGATRCIRARTCALVFREARVGRTIAAHRGEPRCRNVTTQGRVEECRGTIRTPRSSQGNVADARRGCKLSAKKYDSVSGAARRIRCGHGATALHVAHLAVLQHGRSPAKHVVSVSLHVTFSKVLSPTVHVKSVLITHQAAVQELLTQTRSSQGDGL